MGCQITFKKVFVSGEQVHKAEDLGWKGESTEGQRCQVHVATVAGSCGSQTSKIARVLGGEKCSLETHCSYDDASDLREGERIKSCVGIICLILHILQRK